MAEIQNKAYLVPNPIAPTHTVTIDAKKCIACNKCTEKCRMQTIMPHPEKGKPPLLIYPDECWFCGLCVEACPKGAITLHYPINQRLFFKRKTTGEVFRIDGPNAPAQSYFKPPVG
ncbi:MAG: 4Fe-4S binding protein [Acholeplasmataceae bacterium]|jgi:formate hydrogenlyase subunit 6/NADH:ubiquinone oxidoreductase subunit I|nr:4Fe-4S binding protein [Bacillota bacterium]NLY84646.1 4Fe-4S binding protein [Acholeplasmataceae bacterium]